MSVDLRGIVEPFLFHISRGCVSRVGRQARRETDTGRKNPQPGKALSLPYGRPLKRLLVDFASYPPQNDKRRSAPPYGGKPGIAD